MSRNAFLNEVKVALAGCNDAETIFTKISIILENYEVTKRETALVTYEDENTELIKLFVSSLIIDGKAKSTINHYARELKQFALTGNIKEAGAFEIRNYLAKKKMNGVSNRTLENSRAILSSFYTWLTAEDIVKKNPCKTIKPVKFADEIKLPFSTVELDQVRSGCKNDKERAMIEFLLSSGVRVAEFCNLDVTDIDFAMNKVHVRHGKGDKERYTYISDLAKEHLLKYLGDRKDGALFLTKGKERYTKGGVRFLLRSIGERANVENVHPHRFRRTFATTLASRGMPLQDIQKLLGHSNINTTMMYVAISDTETQFAYKKYA